jgi:hypothetical protein
MDARTAEFLEHVQAGGQVEATDWFPDEYGRVSSSSSRCTRTRS